VASVLFLHAVACKKQLQLQHKVATVIIFSRQLNNFIFRKTSDGSVYENNHSQKEPFGLQKDVNCMCYQLKVWAQLHIKGFNLNFNFILPNSVNFVMCLLIEVPLS